MAVVVFAAPALAPTLAPTAFARLAKLKLLALRALASPVAMMGAREAAAAAPPLALGICSTTGGNANDGNDDGNTAGHITLF